jgi:hypothetical protein
VARENALKVTLTDEELARLDELRPRTTRRATAAWPLPSPWSGPCAPVDSTDELDALLRGA